MDSNNWRAAQAQQVQAQIPVQPNDGGGGGGGGGAMPDNVDWRSQLQADSRQRIVNKIMETLKRHLPFSGQEGLLELKKIAVRFEEKIYTAATSQSDYLRKISLKMLTMESKSQAPMPNPLPNNPGTSNQNPADSVSASMQNQIPNQGQQLPLQVMPNQSQVRQPLLPNMTSTGMSNSAGLASALPTAGGLTQGSIANVTSQNSNMQNMHNISNVTQNTMSTSMGQGTPSNMNANTQRQQMQGRQQVVPQQAQQQSQNTSHYLYQQQLQHQLKQKFPGNMPQSLVQPHIQQPQQQSQQQPQQQQQQNLLQPSQHNLMQPSMIQSTPLSNLQQTHQSSTLPSTQTMLQQHSQPVRQQQQQQAPQQMLHQKTSMPQQQILATQQQQQQQQRQQQFQQHQQQMIGQQPSGTNIQQNQLMSQSNSIHDMQQQPAQPQRMIVQQSNISNLQQQQQQQQLLGQQGNLSNMHQQQMGQQSNAAGLQQPQIIGPQSNSSSMPSNQQNVHMLQPSKVPGHQPMQQSAAALLPSQGQQPQQQIQLPQQQLISQMQSQPAQLQQQISGLQQQQVHRDMQRMMTHHQNVVDQQKQLFQSQRQLAEAPSTSLDSTAQTGSVNGGDWQEEAYQKIKSMKEMYFGELNELYQKIAAKLQQHDLPQQPKNEQLEKLKFFKAMLEKLLQFLRLNKSEIQIAHRDKIGPWEKQIVNILHSNRPRKPVSSLPQGQIHPMQQSQQSQSQISQMQPHESQMNPHMQTMNVQSTVTAMQQNNLANLQPTSLPMSNISNASQTMVNSLQSGPGLDPAQGSAQNSLQQVSLGSIQQNPVGGSQQLTMNPLGSQNGINTMQSNLNSLQPNSTMIQHQQLKQQEQQILQSQQLKQMQHRHMQQQFLQRQQLMQHQQQQQQQQHQTKQQQQPSQLPSHQMSQMSQISQMTDANDKMRQQMSVKSGILQQHHSAGQRAAYHHQQLKSGATFPISSPQALQAGSPQVTQHASPQIDQQNLLTSLTKAGTPLQSSSSPFIVPSPSTPLAPSPMQVETEKVNLGFSPLSHAGNHVHQQASIPSVPAQSLAIGTPGISASPLLAEFTSPDGTHGVASTIIGGKSTAVEQPHERLMKVVKSISSKSLTASVSDISSVVSMVDRIAGSAPGNGSRAAVGEDLVAMTKCRLQARNFYTQEGPTGSKKMRRYTSAVPSNVVSSAGSVNDSFRHLNCSETSDLESTATSCIKRPRIEANHALVEEIREINQRLIDTVVVISNEDIDLTAVAGAAEGGEGTLVKCSFSAVALSPNLKSQYASAQMSPIQPLRLLVPNNYPNCSPVLLDKFPVETSKEHEDLSIKAKSKFSVSLRSLSQPMTVAEIARTWDVCARAVISEYAQQTGGGTFSSKYGTWENCLSAA